MYEIKHKDKESNLVSCVVLVAGRKSQVAIVLSLYIQDVLAYEARIRPKIQAVIIINYYQMTILYEAYSDIRKLYNYQEEISDIT